MGIQSRPSDSITVNWAQFGMPYVEFAPLLSSGAYGPYRGLGVIASAEIANDLNIVPLPSTQSGRMVKLKEFVQSVDATINITTRQHSPDNLQLIFGSSSLTAVSGGTETSTDEQFQLTDDEQDYLDLDHQLVDESTVVVSAAPVVSEDVGTGDGTTGDSSGDFSLNFKPLLVGDVSSVTVGGVAFTPIAVGTAAAGNEVEVVVGTGATSGDLQFFVGGVASNVTGAIVASYEPTHSFVLNTDFGVDPKHGRVRMFDVGGATDALKDFQMMEATYDYDEVVHSEIVPWSQLIFEGRTRVRMLSDQGINMIWVIPSTSIRPTSDPYTFDDENPAVANLAIALLDNGTSAPYGTMELYGEESYS